VRFPQNRHRLNTRRAAGLHGRPGSRPRSCLLSGRQLGDSNRASRVRRRYPPEGTSPKEPRRFRRWRSCTVWRDGQRWYPHLAAVAGIAHRENLWQLCRDDNDRSRRPHRRLGYPRPLVRRGRRGYAAARGVATRRDDPLARDRSPDRTARTPRLTLTRGSTSSLLSGAIAGSTAQPRPVDLRRTTEIMKEIICLGL
jgi:hypothetical protein